MKDSMREGLFFVNFALNNLNTDKKREGSRSFPLPSFSFPGRLWLCCPRTGDFRGRLMESLKRARSYQSRLSTHVLLLLAGLCRGGVPWNLKKNQHVIDFCKVYYKNRIIGRWYRRYSRYPAGCGDTTVPARLPTAFCAAGPCRPAGTAGYRHAPGPRPAATAGGA